MIIGAAGYCGGFLAAGLRDVGYDPITLDLIRGHDHECDYRNPTPSAEHAIATSDVVLWFAGYSSVTKASVDTFATLSSNALGLIALRERMQPKALLVYASSASLYSFGNNEEAPWLSDEDRIVIPPSQTAYDKSKFVFDYVQTGFLANCLGLRMGTVAGWGVDAASTRCDTCFNAMSTSALAQSKVFLANPNSCRTILFLPDLLEVVLAILARHQNWPQYPIINVGSINIQMRALAERIAAHFCVPVVPIKQAGNASYYSFRMDLTRQQLLTGKHNWRNPKRCIEENCEHFQDEWRRAYS